MTAAIVKFWEEWMSDSVRIDLGAIVGALATAGVCALFGWVFLLATAQSEQGMRIQAQAQEIERFVELQDNRETRDSVQFDGVKERLRAVELTTGEAKTELGFVRNDLKRILGKLEKLEERQANGN